MLLLLLLLWLQIWSFICCCLAVLGDVDGGVVGGAVVAVASCYKQHLFAIGWLSLVVLINRHMRNPENIMLQQLKMVVRSMFYF